MSELPRWASPPLRPLRSLDGRWRPADDRYPKERHCMTASLQTPGRSSVIWWRSAAVQW